MIICLIPARGGSVRVPRKNIRQFLGRPMLTYAIETAKEAGVFDLIVVSTDDQEIEDVALKSGVLVVRRPKDDGSAGTQEIAARALQNFPSAAVACVLYATSPLLDPADLKRGAAALIESWPHPAFAMSVDPQGQDAGCFYWGWASAFRTGEPLDGPHTEAVQLPADRVCDINTESDWSRAEAMYLALHPEERIDASS